MNIYRDMLTLREFETMINEIKINGQYCGVAYNHPGPAHLSMGQEAAAVGEALPTPTSWPRAFPPSKSCPMTSSWTS